MFGVLLAILCSGLDEFSTSIGKTELKHRVGSIYAVGFISVFLGTLFFVGMGFVRESFMFSMASLPLFIPRVILETLQMHLSILAVVKADRGDFGFMQLLTIPLLLTIDIILGYSFSSSQYLGMGLLFLIIVALIMFERPKRKIIGLMLTIVALSAVTTSLFKYDITHYNSVEAEQAIVGLFIVLYFFVMSVIKKNQNPLQFLRVRAYSLQAGASGLSSVIASFAMLFAPAAIIIAALRSSAVLFSIVSGRYYFHEKHFALRIVLFAGIATSLVLLMR